jgi:hypothetical protein
LHLHVKCSETKSVEISKEVLCRLNDLDFTGVTVKGQDVGAVVCNRCTRWYSSENDGVSLCQMLYNQAGLETIRFRSWNKHSLPHPNETGKEIRHSSHSRKCQLRILKNSVKRPTHDHLLIFAKMIPIDKLVRLVPLPGQLPPAQVGVRVEDRKRGRVVRSRQTVLPDLEVRGEDVVEEVGVAAPEVEVLFHDAVVVPVVEADFAALGRAFGAGDARVEVRRRVLAMREAKCMAAGSGWVICEGGYRCWAVARGFESKGERVLVVNWFRGIRMDLCYKYSMALNINRRTNLAYLQEQRGNHLPIYISQVP